MRVHSRIILSRLLFLSQLPILASNRPTIYNTNQKTSSLPFDMWKRKCMPMVENSFDLFFVWMDGWNGWVDGLLTLFLIKICGLMVCMCVIGCVLLVPVICEFSSSRSRIFDHSTSVPCLSQSHSTSRSWCV